VSEPARRGRHRAQRTVLVRPDGVVAWRSAGPEEDPAAVLRSVVVWLLDARHDSDAGRA